MKKILFGLILMISGQQALCDSLTSISAEKDTTYAIVEVMPEFPGGQQSLSAYIAKNLHYPKMNDEQGVQGKIYIRFVVTKTGEVSNVEVINGKGTALEEEAVRVIKSMPRWTPGKQKGENVNVSYTLPIYIKPTL